MKIVSGIICAALVIAAIIVYINMWRYSKKHADEEFVLHKKYFLTRILLMGALFICASLIELVWFFVR